MLLDPDRLHRLMRKPHGSAKRRAERAGMTFNLGLHDVAGLWWQQDGRCAVSGIGFGFQRFKQAFVTHPYAPGLDRIDPHQGYEPANVRLVCTCVNFGMGQWGEEVLRRVARGLLEEERKPPEPDGDEAWLSAQRI